VASWGRPRGRAPRLGGGGRCNNRCRWPIAAQVDQRVGHDGGPAATAIVAARIWLGDAKAPSHAGVIVLPHGGRAAMSAVLSAAVSAVVSAVVSLHGGRAARPSVGSRTASSGFVR
jgi:hypothetical protein